MQNIAAVDRETASELNPFIGSIDPRDTFNDVAETLCELGYLLSGNCPASGGQGFSIGRLYPLFNCMASALRFESAQKKGDCHD